MQLNDNRRRSIYSPAFFAFTTLRYDDETHIVNKINVISYESAFGSKLEY